MTAAVGDDEQLFRRVRDRVGDQLCCQVIDGRIVFQHAAFNDPKKTPSVDRAVLKCGFDPQLSRLSECDGIVALEAAQIRRLGPISKLDERAKPTEDKYEVNVTADPILGNCSHALVVMSPSKPSSGSFKRLKEGLARLATESGWTIEPHSVLRKRYGYRLRDAFMYLTGRLTGHL